MKNMVKSLLFVFVILMLFAIPAHAGDVNLSGAASLKDVVSELENIFAKNNPGVTFQNNFGASGAVAKQIENGAPADLFFSANLQWMDYLKGKKFMDDKNIRTFAFNTLVFVGKPDLKVKAMRDVAKLDKIAIGSPKSVPAGEYAVQAFKKAGIDKQLENKLVMAKDVRACLMYADSGEVSGAFVYKTDAELMAKNVKILFTVPQDLYPRVTYPVGLTTAGSKKPEAVAFYKFLQSPEAEKVLVKYGFAVK
ncbi:MAG: molybdate ABC transporter substrate-binding protein [Syntrophorhabdaceae bacterium]|nr:molybdate ABC transporter substrate-binding protein [Syntrophorhabdaceae bacterium]MDD4195987.1 molybdate ABC transporter substrate-binding protein [Syntrophorhabdaceae bacterium]HOC45494.1 molybdate ABC transporter substrate-binding protein [Syntrophorhabdaceae bacterium]